VPLYIPAGAPAKPASPRVRGISAFCEKPAQLPHFMWVVGVRAPEIGHGLPSDMLGRYG
jgi:hypothetical protein